MHLELLGADRLALLDDLAADPLVRRFTRVPDPPPPDFASTWFTTYEEGRANGSREVFAIVAGDSDVGVAVEA